MDSRFALPVDTVLDGGYRIERVVGSGGFGITYVAEDIKLGTTVALKEYFPFDSASATGHERSGEVRPAAQGVRMGPFEFSGRGAHASALQASQHCSGRPRLRGQPHRLHGDGVRKGAELRKLAHRPRPVAHAGRAGPHRRASAGCAGDDAREEFPASRHRPTTSSCAATAARCCSISVPHGIRWPRSDER